MTEKQVSLLKKVLVDYKIVHSEIYVEAYQRTDSLVMVYHRIEGKLCHRLKYRSGRGWEVTGNRHLGKQELYISLAKQLNFRCKITP